MGKGVRIKRARGRPERHKTEFSTENYRVLKWSAMLLLSESILPHKEQMETSAENFSHSTGKFHSVQSDENWQTV